MNDILANYLTH